MVYPKITKKQHCFKCNAMWSKMQYSRKCEACLDRREDARTEIADLMSEDPSQLV